MIKISFGFWRYIIFRIIFLELYEFLVFLFFESWYDKYIFGFSKWLCEIIGSNEDFFKFL